MLALSSYSSYVFSSHRKKISSFTIPADDTTKAALNIHEASPAHVTVTPQGPTAKGATACTYM